MKCVVSGNNVKVLGRTMHCLSKIGDEIYLDPGGEGLALHTYNSSKSAYIRFFFHVSFFEVYNSGGQESESSVSVKGILMAFRSLFLIEKTVESCRMEMLTDDLKITLFCKHSVKKSYVLPFLDFSEGGTPRALSVPSPNSNQFVLQARTFSEAVMNFLMNQEEVNMLVDEASFLMKNFSHENEAATKKGGSKKGGGESSMNSVYTELTLKPEEFEDFTIHQASELTFCLRELRPFIGFAESLSCPLVVYFEQGGSPITFEVDTHSTFESKIVLSTSESGSSSSNPDQSLASQYSQGGLPALHPPASSSSSSYLNNSLRMKRKSSTPLPDHHMDPSPRCTPIPVETQPNPQELEQEEQPVPESPPAKKMKYFFKKCFNKTFNPHNVTGAQVVLAPDSDDGDE